MVKRRREISLDPDVIKVVQEKTDQGEICLSRWVNNTLREKYKEEIKNVKKKG